MVECVKMDVRTEAQAEGFVYEKAHYINSVKQRICKRTFL